MRFDIRAKATCLLEKTEYVNFKNQCLYKCVKDRHGYFESNELFTKEQALDRVLDHCGNDELYVLNRISGEDDVIVVIRGEHI